MTFFYCRFCKYHRLHFYTHTQCQKWYSYLLIFIKNWRNHSLILEWKISSASLAETELMMQPVPYCICKLKGLVAVVTQCKHRTHSLNSYIKHQSCTISVYSVIQIIECKWWCCMLHIADECMHHWENTERLHGLFPESLASDSQGGWWLSISVQIPFIQPNQWYFSNDDKSDGLKCIEAVLMDAWAPSQTLINTLQTLQKMTLATRGVVISPILLAFSYLLKWFLPLKLEATRSWILLCGSLSLTGNWS